MHLQQQAVRRFGRLELARVWQAWQHGYREARRLRRALRCAAARLMRPQLSASFTTLRRSWEAAVASARGEELLRVRLARVDSPRQDAPQKRSTQELEAQLRAARRASLAHDYKTSRAHAEEVAKLKERLRRESGERSAIFEERTTLFNQLAAQRAAADAEAARLRRQLEAERAAREAAERLASTATSSAESSVPSSPARNACESSLSVRSTAGGGKVKLPLRDTPTGRKEIYTRSIVGSVRCV